MFTPEEKMQFLNRLPPLELSYEPKLHKKVYSPLYYIVPKGPKALVWYTYWKEQNVCLLIKLNERCNYSVVQLFSTVFTDELALGTIIYGTTFFLAQQTHMQSNTYFTCEKIYYYKGNNVVKKKYQERLQLLLDMFTTQVEQIAYAPNSLIVGLPIICETYEEALTQLEQPYKTYGIAAMGTAAHIKQNGTATHATATHATATHAPTATVTNATVTNTAFATVTNTTVTNTTVTNATATHATVAPIKQNATNTTSYGKAVFKIKAG